MTLATNMLKSYLDAYLFTATGGRVKFYEQMTINSATVNRFFRFKCTHCQDNWNVSSHLFDAQALKIPTELTYWVEKHEHVCTKFNKSPGDVDRSLSELWLGLSQTQAGSTCL